LGKRKGYTPKKSSPFFYFYKHKENYKYNSTDNYPEKDGDFMEVGDLVRINFNGYLGVVENIVPTGNFAYVRHTVTENSHFVRKYGWISADELTVIN
jgi:hypothetical protein